MDRIGDAEKTHLQKQKQWKNNAINVFLAALQSFKKKLILIIF